MSSAPVPTAPSADERFWAGAAHWSSLVAAFMALAFIGPLVVLLVRGGSSPWVRRQAVESLNFVLSVYLYAVVLALAGTVTTILTAGIALVVVLPLAGLLSIGWLVLTVIGAMRASEGVDYRYPLTLRIVS